MSSLDPSLTEFSNRPATWDDLDSVVTFLNNTDEVDIGKRNFSADKLAADWKEPNFLCDSTRVVFSESERIIGYAEAYHPSRAPTKTIVFGRTHPEYRGLGIGTSFLKWGESFAQADLDHNPDADRFYLSALTVDSIAPALELFEDFGMSPVRAYCRMRMDLSTWDLVPVYPPKVKIQPYRHDQDLLQLHNAYERAFAKNWGHHPTSEREGSAIIRRWVENNDSFDAALWILAWDGPEIAGFVLAAEGQGDHEDNGEIYELGVIPRWQKRGLGRALLHQAFQIFKQRETQTVVLDVDADPTAGALEFYERVGMSVMTRRVAYEKTLRESSS
jgi:mycothiol synthase